MRKLLAFLLLASLTARADVRISQLPVGSAAGSNAGDSYPFVNSSTNQTEQMLLGDLNNLPALATGFLNTGSSSQSTSNKTLNSCTITNTGISGSTFSNGNITGSTSTSTTGIIYVNNASGTVHPEITADVTAGTANTIYRIDNNGTDSAARNWALVGVEATGHLRIDASSAKGGTPTSSLSAIDFSPTDQVSFPAYGLTPGVATITASTGALTVQSALANTLGGTGLDSSASTGLAHVATGTWTFSPLVNADVSGSAAIAYSKLNLSASILNGDLAGAVSVAKGGTGQTTANSGFNALAPSQASASGKFLTSNGTDTSWANPSLGNLTGDVTSVGLATTYSGTVPINKGGTGATTAAGARSNLLVAPTIQVFASGSGTYTTPTSPAPLYIKVLMVGGGGGGAGGGTSPGSAGNGGTTTFGTSLLSASGGLGGNPNNPGTATINSPALKIFAVTGGSSNYGFNAASPALGGSGGVSYFGGNGGGGTGAGQSASVNSGSGGAGGATNSGAAAGGIGGCAGGALSSIITGPSATYSYAVGANGAGASGGGSGFNGGDGGSGYIEVTEYYQ